MIRGSDWLSVAVRLTLLVVVVFTAVYFYRRFEVAQIGPSDDSMEILVRIEGGQERVEGYPRGGMILIDLHEGLLERNAVVAFVSSGEAKGAETVRVAKIAGIPGDRIESTKEGITLNGRAIRLGIAKAQKLPDALLGQGFLLDDQYLVFNENPNSLVPDSRMHGAISRTQILGVVVRNWPW